MKEARISALSKFIQKSPTAFHTVASVAQALDEAGFTKLQESAAWELVPGSSYYVTRNESSILAFRLGANASDYGVQIIATHTDSPAFKIKEKAELKTGTAYTRLNTEGYGGMILNTWLDRPLSIAGRVLVKTEGAIESRLLNIDRDLVLIPNVAIHMNREINNGFKYNKQVDLMPLFAGSADNAGVKGLIAAELDVKEEDILGSDLYLYNRQQLSVWGNEAEFISAPRLDDQQCVFASLQAMLEAQSPQDTIQIMACFDNEEVGSGTKQGACSTFLSDVLERIYAALGKNKEELLRSLASGFMLSADNAHAVHPNHPELTDANNCVFMNRGVVVKSHAGQKYTSDGMSIAMVRMLAEKAEVPLQYFSNRSDQMGGSTLGNLSQMQVSLKTVDIGIAQLAMHSSCETAGAKDTEYMIDLMRAFYDAGVREICDGMVMVR